MAKAGHRLELILSVANLDAAAWVWTAVAGDAPPLIDRDGRRELRVESAHGRLRLVEDGSASRSLEAAVAASAMPDLLRAASHAGFTCEPATDGSTDCVVTLRPGVAVIVRAQMAPESPGSTTPPGRLVRRPPRAEAPRAKRPERKNPEAGRAVPESSARAPRRIVRPRGQVRKVGKK